MDREELAKALRATFLEEVDEHLAVFEETLLAAEKAPESTSTEAVQTLFRTAHSVKGAARAVGVGPVEKTFHVVESLLGDVREGRRTLDGPLVELLLQSCDALADGVRRLREDAELAGGPLDGLLPVLEAAVAAPPAASKPAPPPAVAASPPAAAAPPPPPPEMPPAPPAPAAAAPAVPGVARPANPASSIRVASSKLDTLMERGGELVVIRRRLLGRGVEAEGVQRRVAACRRRWKEARALWADLRGAGGSPQELDELLATLGEDLKELQGHTVDLGDRLRADLSTLEEVAGPLQDDVHALRMVPFDSACAGLERAVRDAARTSGKKARLVIEGGSVELDKSVAEALRDPLLHLVRNAVDHGLEAGEVRTAARKDAAGTIRVGAELAGSQVRVRVEDDGGGLDDEAIRSRARERGLPVPEDDSAAWQLLFEPGFSTASAVTELSGRGVGLDVVKSRIEQLQGRVDVSSTPGRGTSFELVVPLTLTTIRGLLVRAGGQVLAIASTAVLRALRIEPDDVSSIQGRDVFTGEGGPLPLGYLAGVLGLPAPLSSRPDGVLPAVLLAGGQQRAALVVDELLSEEEIVVQSLGRRLRGLSHAAGATMLPTGEVALLVNAATVVREVRGSAAPVRERPDSLRPVKRRILVVDDSLTVRSLQRGILEAAGFEVSVAADGQEGWQLLQEDGADIVVSDVEMPRMNGFELTETIRASERFATLPVVLVTALGKEEDRRRGIEAGADAYIVKSAFDQAGLLETLEQLT